MPLSFGHFVYLSKSMGVNFIPVEYFVWKKCNSSLLHRGVHWRQKAVKAEKAGKKIQFTCQRGELIDIDIQIAVHHTLREIFS